MDEDYKQFKLRPLIDLVKAMDRYVSELNAQGYQIVLSGWNWHGPGSEANIRLQPGSQSLHLKIDKET